MIGLCDRWHKLPSEIEAEPAEMFRLLKLMDLTRTESHAE